MTTDLRNGQSAADILTRHGIPIDFEDRQFRVRPRTMKQDRLWLDSVQERITERVMAFWGGDLTVAAIIGALGDSPSDMLDLIVAYDETQQLPPREWIEENAYTAQITTAFTTLLEVAYPPFAVSRRLFPADRSAAILGSLMTYAIERIGSSEPTDSPSANGATEPPTKLTKPSRRASSSS